MQNVQVIPAIKAVTITTTSTKVNVANYKRVGILLRAAGITAGNGAFTVKGGFGANTDSNPTMTSLNTLIDNVTNTNAQALTRVASKTLSTNVDAFLWLDSETPVTHLEITCTVTTDGTYTATLFCFNE